MKLSKPFIILLVKNYLKILNLESSFQFWQTFSIVILNNILKNLIKQLQKLMYTHKKLSKNFYYAIMIIMIWILSWSNKSKVRKPAIM